MKHDAEECKRLSKIVHLCPPIQYKPVPDNIGRRVWCGNEAVEEYWRKQAEEKKHGNRL